MQIFRYRNQVIHDFMENKIKQKESDSNLNSKWKAIQNSNLVKGFKAPKFKFSRYFFISKKSLSELQQDVEKEY